MFSICEGIMKVPYICPADHRANEIKDEQVCRKNNNNNDKINITVHS
jgi:hypothetical protein